MRNVFSIAGLVQTITSRPPWRRSRRCAPIRTPSEEESMNVVAVRSTTTCVRPSSMGAETRCLNSGAVKRSISPATDTMWVSASTERSSIAKAMAIAVGHPRRRRFSIPPEWSVRGARVLQADMEELALALWGHAEFVGELLNHISDTWDSGVNHEGVAAAGTQRTHPQRERARAG